MVASNGPVAKKRREGAGVRARVWEKKKQKLFLARQQKRAEDTLTVPQPSQKNAKGKKRRQQRPKVVQMPPGSGASSLLATPAAPAAAGWPAAMAAAAGGGQQPWLNIPPPAAVGTAARQHAAGAMQAQSAPQHSSAPCAALPAFSPPQWDILYQEQELERKLQPLLHEPAIGLDIEWRPTFVAGQPRNKVALLQLSSMTRCMLIPLRHIKSLPPSLASLLASPRVYKVGCGVVDDARKLLEDYGLTCTPTLEIGDAAVRLQQRGEEEDAAGGGAAAAALRFPALPEGDVVRPGLKNLALACGYELSKPKKVTRSNWEAPRLTPQQQKYAALDAYAGVWIARCVHALHSPLCGKPDFAQWLRRMHSDEQQVKASPPAKKSRSRKRKSDA